MDFVVVGLGLGALMMLAGFGLRDLGPWLFGSNASEQALPEFEAVKTTIRKQTLTSIGIATAAAGAGLALVTSAALFAKTDDDIGTIVVGMALALTTVGIGAWTYDAIRRYRTAMEMISHQEEAVVARITARPAAQKAAGPRTLTTRPDLATPVTTVAAEKSGENTGSSEILENNGETASNGDHAPEAVDDAEHDADLFEPELEEIEDWPAAPTADISDLVRERTIESAATPVVEPVPAVEPEPAPESTTAPTDASRQPKWSSFARFTPPPDDTRGEADFTVLPPLPEPGSDTLIEEAVRFEYHRPSDRKVPSWLFDDLETDLASDATSTPEDPIDRFRGSLPRARGSALDRILAGDTGDEDDKEPEGD